MNTDDEWTDPPKELQERAEIDCLAAAVDAFDGIKPDADEDDEQIVLAILKAFAAVNAKATAINKEFVAGRRRVHDIYVDVHHIVASAMVSVVDNADVHPYSLVAMPMLRFATACAVMSHLSVAISSLEGPFGGHNAEEALWLFKRIQSAES